MKLVEIKIPQIVIESQDSYRAFQCPDESCGRIYTLLGGYHELRKDSGLSSHGPLDPYCKEHKYWMSVRETLPESLKYVCPLEGCSAAQEVKLDSKDS